MAKGWGAERREEQRPFSSTGCERVMDEILPHTQEDSAHRGRKEQPSATLHRPSSPSFALHTNTTHLHLQDKPTGCHFSTPTLPRA